MIDGRQTKFTFASKAMDAETFTVVRFSGTEGLSQTYHFDVMLASENPQVDLRAVLDNPATFTIKRQEGDIPFHGYVIEFEQLHQTSGVYFYRAELVPRFWWLSLTRHNQIMLDKTVPEAVEAVLKDGGLSSRDYRLAINGGYRKREYICQYEETHLNFVSRWMEWAGIYYYFEQGDGGEKLIVTDTLMAHDAMPQGKKMVYSPPTGLERPYFEEVVHHFFCRQRKMPHSVSVKDYNYRTPDLDLTGKAEVSPSGLGNFYHYGDHFQTPQEGQIQARLRAEELKRREQVFHGESSVPFMRPGYLFTMEQHYRDQFNRDYMTIEVTHEGSQAAFLRSGLGMASMESDKQPFYRNHFSCIPSHIQFRPERLHAPSRIHGTINAHIDAEGGGDFAQVDEQGRYKVTLPFDLSGRTGGKASAWLRMAQPYAGSDHGMHFPLHKGTEVLLTFIDGNPDRPIIAAAVPNPDQPSVINSGSETMAGFKSGSGGGLHMEDTKGHERMVLHSGNQRSFIKIGSGSDDETWVKSDWWSSVSTWGKNDFTGEFSKASSMWKNSTSTGGLSYQIFSKVITGLFNNLPNIGEGVTKSALGSPSKNAPEAPTEPTEPTMPDIKDPGDPPQMGTDGMTPSYKNRVKEYRTQKDKYDRNKKRYDAEKAQYDKDLEKYKKDYDTYQQKLAEYNSDPDAWKSNAETVETVKKALGCVSTVVQPLWEMGVDIFMDKTIAKGLKKVLKTKSPSADAVEKYDGRYCFSVISSGDEVEVNQVSPMTGKNLGMLMASAGTDSVQAGVDAGTKQTEDGSSTGVAAGVGAATGATTALAKTPNMIKWAKEYGKDKIPATKRKGMLFLADEGHMVLHAITGDATFRGGKHTEIFGDEQFTLKSKDIVIGDSMLPVLQEDSSICAHTKDCCVWGANGLELSTGKVSSSDIHDIPANRFKKSVSAGILVNAGKSHDIKIKQDSANTSGTIEVDSNKEVTIKTKSAKITIVEKKITVDCTSGEVDIKGPSGGVVKLADGKVQVAHDSKVQLVQGGQTSLTVANDDVRADCNNIKFTTTGSSTINSSSIKLG